MLALCKSFDTTLELKYNKFYIGLASGGVTNNFVECRPRKAYLNMAIRLPQTEALTTRLEESGVDLLDYGHRWGRYRIQVDEKSFAKHEQLIGELLRLAYDNSR